MSDIKVIISQPVTKTVKVIQGIQGAPGVGVPSGGTTGQLLAKKTNDNYVTEWIDPPNVESFEQSFLVSDWVGPSAGYYSITFNHQLNSEYVEVDCWDAGENELIIDRDIIDNNSLKVKVLASPDLRFQGKIFIKTT